MDPYLGLNPQWEALSISTQQTEPCSGDNAGHIVLESVAFPWRWQPHPHLTPSTAASRAVVPPDQSLSTHWHPEAPGTENRTRPQVLATVCSLQGSNLPGTSGLWGTRMKERKWNLRIDWNVPKELSPRGMHVCSSLWLSCTRRTFANQPGFNITPPHPAPPHRAGSAGGSVFTCLSEPHFYHLKNDVNNWDLGERLQELNHSDIKRTQSNSELSFCHMENCTRSLWSLWWFRILLFRGKFDFFNRWTWTSHDSRGGGGCSEWCIL